MTASSDLVPSGYSLLHLPLCDSTNFEAQNRGTGEGAKNLWVVADEQTSGRGRSGRQWSSLKGNLFASVVLRPSCSLEQAAQLSFVTAVAVAEVVEALLDESVRNYPVSLKWPNDLLVGGKKAGGILIESASVEEGEGFSVVVGIGLNLVAHPDLADNTTDIEATNLSACGGSVERWAVFKLLAERFDHWVRLWRDGTCFEPVRTAWIRRAFGVGEEIEARLPHSTKRGIFQGVDERGALILESSNGERTVVTSGEVFFGPSRSNSSCLP